jgi:hypothetical protein
MDKCGDACEPGTHSPVMWMCTNRVGQDLDEGVTAGTAVLMHGRVGVHLFVPRAHATIRFVHGSASFVYNCAPGINELIRCIGHKINCANL